MRTNRTKAKLAAGQVALGVCVSSFSPDMIELCAAVGFDLVTIDIEHEGIGYEEVVNLKRQKASISPFCREACANAASSRGHPSRC